MPHKLVTSYWTNKFYDIAPNFIKTKIPVVVPSYNRYENNYFLNVVRKQNSTWPIFVVVRKSQVKLYRQNYKDLSNVTFVSFDDEKINNIGKTRQQIVKYFTKKFDNVIMCDDDCVLVLRTKAIRKNNDGIESTRYSINFNKDKLDNLFAMWQLTHEYLIEKYPNCWITHPSFYDFAFDAAYGEEKSYSIGALAACVFCANLKLLREHKLNYVSSEETGHEDIDLLIRALKLGLFPISIKYFNTKNTHYAGSEVEKSLNFDNEEERLAYQGQKLYELYKDYPYVTLNKHNTILIKWNRYVKDNHIEPKTGSIRKELYNKLKKGN